MGTPVVALCGKVWVPSRAPEKFPVCPECKEIWESLNDDAGSDGVTGRPEADPQPTRSLRPGRSAPPGGRRTSLRAWQTAAMKQYFDAAPARLPRGRDARRRQDDVRAVGRRRAARPPDRRPDHGRRADRAPQDPVGRGRRPGRHPDRPDVLRRQGQDLAGLRRHRGDLRRRRGQPAGDADPHRAVQDAGDPRRGAPRRRRAVVGRGRPRGVRAGRPPARADRHAVPLRRQPDPVRHLRARRRRRAALGRRLHLRLRARAGRPRRPAGAVHGLLRRDAVAHPRRRRDRRPARRAADQGPHRAGAAHRARPGRRRGSRRCWRPRTGGSPRYAGTSRTPAGW